MINVKYTITYFNSQPHEEADGQIRRCVKREQYFNSQPHEEADEQRKAEEKARLHFNSQPHEEADRNFRQKYIYLKLFFMLIAHTNLVFLFKLLYCRFFSGKIHTFSGANVLKYFCKLTFRTIILKYL